MLWVRPLGLMLELEQSALQRGRRLQRVSKGIVWLIPGPVKRNAPVSIQK